MTRVVLRRGAVLAPAAPGATALGTDGARVAWVGSEADAERHAADADEVVELGGRLVTPAFVDAHAHAAQTGLSAEALDLRSTRSLADALQRLERYAASHSQPVLLGFGWDESTWPEGRTFTGDEVDRAAGGRICYLARVDVHSAVVSSGFVHRAPKLRETEGWSADGRVERDAHHLARDLTNDLVTPGQRRDAIARGLSAAAAAGIGCVHEIGAPHRSRPGDFAVIVELAAEQRLPHVVGYWGELGAVDTATELGCLGVAGDLCVDGAIGSRTAATVDPYADADTRGHLYLHREQIRDHTLAATRAGLQAGFHCIGDAAVQETVAGLGDAAVIVGVEAMIASRHRLEHVEMIDAAGISALSRMGVVASVQPAFDAAWGGPEGMYAARLGPQRSRQMNPYRSMASAGVVLAFGSDTPVTAFDPWGAVRAAAWHSNPDERLTPLAAFRAHTEGGWVAAKRDSAGRLTAGAAASYAVWDADATGGEDGLPDVAPGRRLPTCVRTVVDGRVVFDLEGVLG